MKNINEFSRNTQTLCITKNIGCYSPSAPYFFTFHKLNITIECKEAWNFQQLFYLIESFCV